MRTLPGLLVLFVVAPAAADAGSSGAAHPVPAVTAAPGCAAQTSSILRARLWVDTTRIGDAGPAIRAIVSETWARQGLSIEWVVDPPGAERTWDGVDAWIAVRHAAAHRHRKNAIGGAMFVESVPNGLVLVSIDAAVKWHKDEQARRLRIKSGEYAPPLEHTAPALYAILGHVVAHEIGHIALRTRDHGRHGLMKANYDDLTTLSSPEPLPLDRVNRRRLSARLNAAAACQALNASNQVRAGRGRDQYR